MDKTITNISQWQEIAKEIAENLQYNILLLKGNLGAGKTTFTKTLLQEIGSNDEVSSPTYSIVNEYNTSKGKVFHFDLYRLKNIEEAFDFGIEEYLDTGFLNIIEWPEIYEPELSGMGYHEMTIENSDEKRIIHFK